METVKLLVEGGKAAPGPHTAGLSAMGVNIGKLIAEINEKTRDYEGMQVPVEVKVDPKTKEWKISVGTPPVSSLIKKELGLKKLAKAPFGTYKPKEGEEVENFSADLTKEQVIKITKMKFGEVTPSTVKQVLGTCQSCGVTVEGRQPKEIDPAGWKDLNTGEQ